MIATQLNVLRVGHVDYTTAKTGDRAKCPATS